MTAIYSVKFKVNEENKANFDKAFSNIYTLSTLLCKSNNEDVAIFVSDPCGAAENWLGIDNEKSTINIMTEKGLVNIGRNDALSQTDIEYDFGKRAPAEDGYVLAVIAIVFHYFPNAILHNDIEEDDFDDGVYLARIVNSKIKNPLNKEKEPQPSENIKEIFSTLKEKEKEKPQLDKQLKKHKITALDSPILAKKIKSENKEEENKEEKESSLLP